MSVANASLSPPLQSALAAIHSAIIGMTDEQLAWHPAGKWSSAEILEHLSLAYSRTTHRMKPLLAQGQPEQDQPELRRRTFTEWFGGLLVLRIGHIPRGRKAPEALCPQGLSCIEARIKVADKLCLLDQTISDLEARFGPEKTVLVHSILGPLSTSDWRRFHCVHTLHHVKQIQTLRAALATPGRSGG